LSPEDTLHQFCHMIEVIQGKQGNHLVLVEGLPLAQQDESASQLQSLVSDRCHTPSMPLLGTLEGEDRLAATKHSD